MASAWTISMNHPFLLYLPTQIRFLIGGERVTCHWSKLNDALGRTKLNDALGKQQLELWTRTWSRCAPWNRRKFVYRSSSETQGLLAETMRYFRAKVYFKSWRAPGNLFLPNQFQKWSNSVPLIGQKNTQSAMRSSRVTLSPSYTK